MSPRAEPVVIGWNELVDLPDWGVKRLRAKVDTGARSSAVHVENLEELSRGRVRFDVVLHRKKRDRHIHVIAPISRRSRVRSSNGRTETRFFVKTRLQLGPVDKEVEISLVDRGRMIHRMLLGRSALAGPFLSDVDRRMLLGKKLEGLLLENEELHEQVEEVQEQLDTRTEERDEMRRAAQQFAERFLHSSIRAVKSTRS